MNFGFTEDQEMIRKSARDFVKGESSFERIRELAGGDVGYSTALWQNMAEFGWLGAVYPEEYGGLGLGYADLICILEEFGQGLMPEPVVTTVVLAGNAILAHGTDDQKKELLSAIAEGTTTATLAAYEADGRFNLAHVETSAKQSGDDYVLNGAKCYVPNAETSDKILVTARIGSGDQKPAFQSPGGITLFIVDRDTPGISVTPISTVDRRKRAHVNFENVTLSADAIIGTPGNALEAVESAVDCASVALCAEMVGAMDKALNMTVEYAQERVQFGQVIGSFQAVKHKAADMFVSMEMARSAMHYAAMALDQDAPDLRAAVSTAKAVCSEAFLAVSKEAIQLHGGIGFTHEHDIHLFYNCALAANVAFGDPAYHRDRYAKEIGLIEAPAQQRKRSEAGATSA